jgi:predicted unusual protein kinase regulating ubiquinone biosynthesis (AarF/ABC1/UbiB family)
VARSDDGDRDEVLSGSAYRRASRMAGLPLGMVGRSMTGWARRVAGGDADAVYSDVLARNAEQIFAVLGQLRGGAQKLGQTLAVFESMMPAEVAEPYQRALVKLQTQGSSMAPRTVHRVLAEQLGSRWRERFSSFSDEPHGAASLGQVHQAVWHDGREVAVKVQYPGADTALRSDLRTLQRFTRPLSVVMPGLDARSLLNEIAERTVEELDYRAEADNQRRYAEAVVDDPEVRIPAVVASSPKVLVAEWIEGTPLSGWVRTPPASDDEQLERDRVAGALVELLFSSPQRVGLLHGDPHPGNVLVCPDGKLGLIDFGAVARIPEGIPAVFGSILRAAADNDVEATTRYCREAGFLGGDTGAEDVLRWIGALADPLRRETFRFTEAWMRREGARILNPANNAYKGTGRSVNLPPEYMPYLRVTGGWMNVLGQIDVTVAARPMAEQWVPGFATGSPAVHP